MGLFCLWREKNAYDKFNDFRTSIFLDTLIQYGVQMNPVLEMNAPRQLFSIDLLDYEILCVDPMSLLGKIVLNFKMGEVRRKRGLSLAN